MPSKKLYKICHVSDTDDEGVYTGNRDGLENMVRKSNEYTKYGITMNIENLKYIGLGNNKLRKKKFILC